MLIKYMRVWFLQEEQDAWCGSQFSWPALTAFYLDLFHLKIIINNDLTHNHRQACASDHMLWHPEKQTLQRPAAENIIMNICFWTFRVLYKISAVQKGQWPAWLRVLYWSTLIIFSKRGSLHMSNLLPIKRRSIGKLATMSNMNQPLK